MSGGYADSGYKSLPPEVLEVLPLESHLQLELAHSITCHAYVQRVSKLEEQAEQLESSLAQSHQTIKSLERRVANVETELLEQQQRARQAMTEQHKLVAEKNALIETVKRLNREVAKLEHFKRNLLQQLQEDNEAEAAGSLSPAFAAVDLTTERLVSEVLHSADGIAAAAAAAAAGAASSGYQQHQRQAGGGGQHAALYGGWSPSKQSGPAGAAGKLQGGDSPGSGNPYSNAGYSSKAVLGEGSGGGHVAGGNGGGSPYRGLHRSASSPCKEAVVGSQVGLPAAAGAAGGVGATSAQMAGGPAGSRGLGAQSSAAAGANRFASPPQGASRASAAGRTSMTSPRIDGKEFFRQARARLSYEQFSQFLVAIKELNAGRASREDTLAAAKKLFGPGNSDLYGLFEGLLMRHLTSF